MALIIEIGSALDDATSYVTVDEVRAFATSRGITSLPAADADVEPLIIKAMDYVENLARRFKGVKYRRDQALQWPRNYVYIDGYVVYHDEIPKTLKNAVCQLAIDANALDIEPNGDGQEVIREKIGPIETEYTKRGSGTVRPQLNKAYKLLRPVLKDGFGANVTRA